MKEVTVIYARDCYVLCPECNEIIDGWYGDIRGEEDTCLHCGAKYKVHQGADYEPEM